MVAMIEQRSKLKIDSLVSNTNISTETSIDLILQGHQIVQEAAKKLNLSISQITIYEDLIPDLPKEFYNKNKDIITPLKLYTRLKWM